MSEPISVLIAFGAGLLSFLSPCVLPLIPSYLCVIGGGLASPDSGENFKPRLVARTLAFILGFAAIFIALSVLFSAAFSLMGGVSRWLNLVSGIVVILLGVNIIFDFISFLNFEKRLHFGKNPQGLVGAFVMGAAFGAGWTPCVGPVLASILLLAAQSGGIPTAVLYLACYSAGLGLPFLLASLFFNRFVKTQKKLRPYLPLIRRISGALLVAIGLLMVTGQYQVLNGLAAKWQSKLLGGTAAVVDETEDDNGEFTGFSGAGAASGGDAQSTAIAPNVAAAFNAAGLPPAREGIAPVDFTLPLVGGGTQQLSGLKGSVVLLNFWATWCGPCRMEMPSMEQVYRQLKEKGFTILAVDLGEKEPQVAAFLRENKLTFPAALDANGQIGRQYGAQAIPTTYIIDRRGLIVSRVVGSIDWNEPEILAALEALLGE